MKIEKILEHGLWAFDGLEKVSQLYGKFWAFKQANLSKIDQLALGQVDYEFKIRAKNENFDDNLNWDGVLTLFTIEKEILHLIMTSSTLKFDDKDLNKPNVPYKNYAEIIRTERALSMNCAKKILEVLSANENIFENFADFTVLFKVLNVIFKRASIFNARDSEYEV